MHWPVIGIGNLCHLPNQSDARHKSIIIWSFTFWCKYRKSYERKCISWFMGTSDVLKVLKIAQAIGECNLRTFKTSRVTINHEMHEQVHTIFYLLYSRFFYNLVFKFGASRCFHGNFSVVHSITSIALYNLFMYSSLTNQKRDILLSI